MSSTTRFKSQAPLLISCTLPLVTIAQQPAGSFRERTASHFSFQQSCPPDFPMPDIWERQGAGPIDIPSFAPVWLTSSFGWNRPLIFGSVPAEIVSRRFRKLAIARKSVSRRAAGGCSALRGSTLASAAPRETDFRATVPSRMMGAPATLSPPQRARTRRA